MKRTILLTLIFLSCTAFVKTLLASNRTFDHIIITSELFKSDTSRYSLNTLVKHRKKNGINSTIVTTDSIYANFKGVDNQEKIRNFIREAKESWNTKYILLGGDVNVVPVRMLFARNAYMASDMYYACLQNSFNDDGDNRWGELNDGLDFEYDLFVGRASAENLNEIQNFVYKTITYENSPNNASYHTKMLHMNQEAKGIGNTEKWAQRYRDKSKELTFEFYRVTDQQADPITNNRLNNGNVGYYLGASHGFVKKLANITQPEALKFNNGNEFYFMTSIACLSGKFDEDCIAETFCTSTRKGGAFAGMFNSEDAFPPYVVQYIYKLRDLHFQDKVTKLGVLRAKVAETYKFADYLKNDAVGMARRYQAYQYNLFGDPATDLKTCLSKPIDLHLKADSINESVVFDASGNANHANIQGAVDTTTIFGAKSFKFDGKSGFLSIPHNHWNALGKQVEFSISSWIYIDSLGGKQGLFVKGNTKNPFGLYINEDGRLKLEINHNRPSHYWKLAYKTSEFSLSTKKLYHIACVLEYESLKAHLYIDGNLTESFSIPENYLLGESKDPLYIGKNPHNSNGFFNGIMSNIQIYSRSLSAIEIKKLAERNTSSATNITDLQVDKCIIFPNPAKHYICIKCNTNNAPQTIKFFDSSGRQILEKTQICREKTVKLDISFLPSGVYTLAVISKNGTIKYKVIKQLDA